MESQWRTESNGKLQVKKYSDLMANETSLTANFLPWWNYFWEAKIIRGDLKDIEQEVQNEMQEAWPPRASK